MFSALLLIGGLLAGSYLVYKAVKFTWEWLKSFLRSLKVKSTAKKFLVVTVQRLINDARHQITMEQLNRLVALEREGKRHVVFGLDNDNDMTGKMTVIENQEAVEGRLKSTLDKNNGVLIAEFDS